MFDDVKYIVSEHVAHIVPSTMTHREYASRMLMESDDIQGAGFISFGSFGMPTCYGESVSLRKKSRPEEDTQIVKRFFRMDLDYVEYGEQMYDDVKRELDNLRESKSLTTRMQNLLKTIWHNIITINKRRMLLRQKKL